MAARLKGLGGRPPKPAREVRRHRVVALLNIAEYRALARVARKRGVVIGQAARELLAETLGVEGGER